MRLLLPLLALAALFDVIFAWLSYPDLHDEGDLQQYAKPWQPVKLPEQSLPSINKLTASGFWGESDGQQAAGSTIQSAKALAETEAKVVRRRVRAIVKGASGKQVLFEVGKKFQHFSVGDKLPGTQWTLLGIKKYSLTLIKNEADSVPRELRLYGDNSLVALGVAEPKAENAEPQAPLQQVPVVNVTGP
ncbi:MAG: hypothetical protein ACJA0N_000061 [Pseudohongiellaceae bacterium]|jgi:hypothetical protein